MFRCVSVGIYFIPDDGRYHHGDKKGIVIDSFQSSDQESIERVMEITTGTNVQVKYEIGEEYCSFQTLGNILRFSTTTGKWL